MAIIILELRHGKTESQVKRVARQHLSSQGRAGHRPMSQTHETDSTRTGLAVPELLSSSSCFSSSLVVDPRTCGRQGHRFS